MKHVIPVDFSKFAKDAHHSEFLAGPATGVDSAYVICSRVPAGARGPALHVHPADQFYYIVSGTMQVQLGTETFAAKPDTLVCIPEGTPHCNWNTGAEDEVHIEIIVPPPPFEALAKFAEARHVPNAASLIRPLDRSKYIRHGTGFDSVFLANRETGSPRAAIHIAEVQPGSGGPQAHIHAFDQFYFVITGGMEVDVGLNHFRAPPMSAVVLPAGMIHRNWNSGAAVEKHLTLLVPEPKKGEIFDYPVEIKQKEAQAL